MTQPPWLDGALSIAEKISEVFPGLAIEHDDIKFMRNVAPSATTALDFFQTKDGLDAIRHVEEFLAFFQTEAGQKAIAHVRAVLAASQR